MTMKHPVIVPPSELWAAALNKHLIPALQKQEKPVSYVEEIKPCKKNCPSRPSKK